MRKYIFAILLLFEISFLFLMPSGNCEEYSVSIVCDSCPSCIGDVIELKIVTNVPEPYAITWYESDDGGQTFEPIQGECNANLLIKLPEDFQQYCYKVEVLPIENNVEVALEEAEDEIIETEQEELLPLETEEQIENEEEEVNDCSGEEISPEASEEYKYE